MQNQFYKHLLDQAPFAYGYHKIIKNNENEIIDFSLIYSNLSLKKILKQENSKDLKEIYKIKFGLDIQWNKILSNVLKSKDPFDFYYFDFKLCTHYKIHLYSDKKDFFSIAIHETQEKNNAYKELVKATREGITVIQNNKFVFFNKTVEDLTSYSYEELQNMNINDLVHTEDLNISFSNYRSSPFDSYVEPYQIRIVNKNKKVKWIEISSSDFEWNNTPAALCLLIDVTKRKEIEDLLKESERRKNLLIKGMNNLILILDSDFSLLEYYSSSNKIFFFKPKNFIGKKLQDLKMPEETSKKLLGALENTKNSQEPSHVEFFLKIHEKKHWFDVSITLINDSISVGKEYLCVVREITLLKDSEIEIKAERDLFSAGPVMTIVWNHFNWTIKRISKNVKQILGYDSDFFMDKDFDYSSLIYKDDVYKASNEFDHCVKNCINSFEQSYRLKHKNGQYLWFYDFTKIMRDSKGNIEEIRGYLFDQSHIKEVEQQLENERERLKNIIKGTNAGTWEWNIEKDEIILDKRWSEIIGYSLDEVQPMNIKRLKHFIHEKDFIKNEILLKRHFKKELEYFQTELRLLHKKNKWIWVTIHGKVLNWTKDKRPEVMFGTILDITEKKKVEEKIIEASIKDPLTNLYNRRYIFDRLEEIKAKFDRNKEIFSVALIDLDFFKHINDNYGHIAGDFILQNFANILKEKFRIFDLIGRYGGEEFIVVMSGCSKEDAENRMNELLNDIRKTSFDYKENKIKLTFSCGISDSKDLDLIILDKLIDLADKRLYKAKHFGRNRVIT